MADLQLEGKEMLPLSHAGVPATPAHTSCSPPLSVGQVRPIPRNGDPDRPEDGAHGDPAQPPAPGWKAPARPGLAQRKELPPAAWEQEQGHNKEPSTEWAQPQATAAAGAEAAKPQAAKLRPLQASRAPRAQDGAVAGEKGQGRKARVREARSRGLKLGRPPKGEDQPG